MKTQLVLISIQFRGVWHHSLTLGRVHGDGKMRVPVEAYENLIRHVGAQGHCVRWA